MGGEVGRVGGQTFAQLADETALNVLGALRCMKSGCRRGLEAGSRGHIPAVIHNSAGI